MKKPTPNNGPASDDKPPAPGTAKTKSGKLNEPKGKGKANWVNTFRCFNCGKSGHNLPKCSQCGQAYYCNADCQREHWRRHRPVCRAAVAALARRANRERLARVVREKGRDNVAGAADDDLCVICLAEPVDPVEVGRNIPK